MPIVVATMLVSFVAPKQGRTGSSEFFTVISVKCCQPLGFTPRFRSAHRALFLVDALTVADGFVVFVDSDGAIFLLFLELFRCTQTEWEILIGGDALDQGMRLELGQIENYPGSTVSASPGCGGRNGVPWQRIIEEVSPVCVSEFRMSGKTMSDATPLNCVEAPLTR